jgi:hypothetical protein
MALQDGMVLLLQQDRTYSSLVNPLSTVPVGAVNKQVYPVVVYHQGTQYDLLDVNGSTGNRTARVQFDAYSAKSYTEAKAIAKAIRGVFSNLNNTVLPDASSTFVQCFYVSQEADMTMIPQGVLTVEYRVMVEIEVMYFEPLPLKYTILASDTFKRANENPVNPAVWSADIPDSISASQIINNELCPTSAESIARYTGIVWPSNQFIQCQVDACEFHTEVGEDFASVLIVGRRLNSGNGYALEIDGPLGPNCNVSFFVETSSGATSFFEGTANVPAGSIIRMEMFGSQISAYINGVLLMSVTDTQLTAGGQVAIDLFETVSDPAPSNVKVSNFVAGSIIQP